MFVEHTGSRASVNLPGLLGSSRKAWEEKEVILTCLHFYFLPEKQTYLWWSLLNICKWFDVLDENLTWKQSLTALRSMEDGFSICLKPCLKGSTRMSFRCLRDSSMSFFLTPRRIWRRELPFLSANVDKESCFMETTLALSAATYLLIYFALIKINLKFQFCI